MDGLMQGWFSGPLGTALVRLLNMSAAGAVLICAVVLLRALLRRAPKWTRGILWAIVAVQLVCPLSLRSPLSVYRLLPARTGTEENIAVFELGGGSEKPLLTVAAPQHPTGNAASAVPASDLPPSVYLLTAGEVWLIGLAAMLLYALISWLTLRRRLRASVALEPPFRLCDHIDSPFILGLFRPRVYLPSGLSDAQRAAVIAHETAHLRRRDHWWKPLGFLLLAVHWFNPLVWLAYILLCRDIELACDEKAVREMDVAARADYSQALLDCSAPRALVHICPLAFGELGVRERIRAVLHYKKPAFWLVVLAVAVCGVVGVCFLTRPGPEQATEPETVTVSPAPTPFMPLYDGIQMESAKTYWLDGEYYSDASDPFHLFSITLDMENGSFQFYETPISSHIGHGQYELEGDILTLRSNSVNRFRMEDDKLVWLEDGSDNFPFVHLTDGATFSLDRTPFAPARRMTLDDVRALAQQGEALTWDALLQFEGEDIGSGLYIYRFPIDESYCLQAHGASLEGAPMRVLLLAADEAGQFRPATGYSIDIRTDDIDAFLTAQAQKGAFLTVTSGGQSVAAYPVVMYERRWTDYGWLYADGAPTAAKVLEHPERIPTLTLGEDFSAVAGGGAVRKSGLTVYDEQFTPLRADWYGDTALNWLEPGAYYCAIEVFGPPGKYIEAEQASEERAYRCVFRLVVSETGPAPYTPEEAQGLTRATLRFHGKDYVLTDARSLRHLEGWLSHATELHGGAGCPFGSLLTLTRSDGSEISLCPAEDSCGVVFADGHFYRYAPGNEAFWSQFGIGIVTER